MNVRRLLRRYGFHGTLGAGLVLLAGASWLTWELATEDILAEVDALLAEGEHAEARRLARHYLESEGDEADADGAHFRIARSIHDENAARGTLTVEVLDDVRDELTLVESGDAEQFFPFAWTLAAAYGASGAHERRLEVLDWLAERFPKRPEVDLERARTLLDLGPVHRRDGDAGRLDRFEALLTGYRKEAEGPEVGPTLVFLRAEALERSAAFHRDRAGSRERVQTVDSYRSEIEWVLAREADVVALLDRFLDSPGDADEAAICRARHRKAESLARQAELLDGLRGRWTARYGEEGTSPSELAVWSGQAEALRSAARSLLEQVVADPALGAEARGRARYRLAGLYRLAGDHEAASKVYGALAAEGGVEGADETAVRGSLLSLLGRARIAIDLTLAAEGSVAIDEAAWGEIEAILARFEAEVGRRPELLAAGGEANEQLRAARIEAEQRVLADFLARTEVRPELGRRRRIEVAARASAFADRYGRRAADLHWNASRLAEEADLRLEEAWRAAENFRAVGYRSAEIQALREFLERAERDPRPTAALFHLGRALEDRGLLDEAEQAHRTNVDRYRSTPFAYRSRFDLGRLAEARGDLDTALARYSSIRNDAHVEFDPSSRVWRNALFGLARVYERMSVLGQVEGGLARADELYREALRRYPDDFRRAEAHFRLAWNAGRDGRFAEAIAQIQAAIAVSEGEAPGALDEPGLAASPDVDEFGVRPPPDPAVMVRQSRYTLADLEYRQALAAGPAGRADGLAAALEAYDRALSRHPGGVEEAWAYYQLGQIHRLRERPAESRNALEKSRLLLERAGSRERPEGFDPAYWSGILEWEERFKNELAGRRKES